MHSQSVLEVLPTLLELFLNLAMIVGAPSKLVDGFTIRQNEYSYPMHCSWMTDRLSQGDILVPSQPPDGQTVPKHATVSSFLHSLANWAKRATLEVLFLVLSITFGLSCSSRIMTRNEERQLNLVLRRAGVGRRDGLGSANTLEGRQFPGFSTTRQWMDGWMDGVYGYQFETTKNVLILSHDIA